MALTRTCSDGADSTQKCSSCRQPATADLCESTSGTVRLASETTWPINPESLRPDGSEVAPLDEPRACGRATAAALGPAAPRPWLAGAIKRHTRSLRRVLYSGLAAHPAARPHRNWLAENGRLIAATVKEIQDLAGDARHLPAVGPDPSAPVLRICVLAEAFLDHVDSRFDE